MLTRSLLPVLALELLGAGCGGDAIIVDDDGISSGGVKLETIEPPRGSILGGQNILLEGEGLGGNNVVVAFGEVAASDVVVVSSGALLVVSPPGLAPGPVDIIIANSRGFAQRNAGFTYNDPPSIAAVSPDRGPRAGGDTVTITGTGFQDLEAGPNEVTFDGEPASEVTVVSDTELAVTTPPGVPFAPATVAVENANGIAALADSYTYEANGLFASVPDPTACRGSNTHGVEAGLFFIDLDDNSIIDLGLDDELGFVQLAVDGQGGLVGMQACTEDLFRIDLANQRADLLIVTNRLTGGRRHMGSMARLGNDFIVRFPPDPTQFARISSATGDVTPIGSPGGNPSVVSGRGGAFFDGGRMFYAGVVNTPGGAVNGIAEIDPATGLQIGDGLPLQGNIAILGATLHRGELFVTRRDASINRLVSLLRIDRGTGAVEFVSVLPFYLKGLASGDL